MRARIPWVAWGAAALCAALAGFWVARHLESPAPELTSGTWLAQRRVLPDFALTDDVGRPLTLRELRGRPTLVFFGFTNCPDVCPTTLARLAQTAKAAALPQLRVLFISVDPARDTPETLGRYVHAFDPRFTGATGTAAAIDNLTREFGVAVQRVDLGAGQYTMDHSAAVFLLDDQARIVGILTPPFNAGQIAADLRRVAPLLHG